MISHFNSDSLALHCAEHCSFDYLHRILCHRIVPVEQGSKYTDSDWAQKLMTGSEFFETLLEDKNVDKNGWIGPGSTVSPLHTDPRENIFCQVDVLNPDLEKYPNFAKARCWDGVVEAGDVLFIPQGWWHLVAALSNSVSISFWFDK
ncbi:hypothetical protein TELCIR_18364 [Teladorsagia circumcincta]|uniref:JmjC domain-containing protein n=1 Tax=Teladorsagia circumcincta TaxID=45464 RepID=A0A2G9TQD1_TELCI|nr:hypothetical protein TELCIR_18364 [Teladorsagia circumcincta]